MGAPGAIVKTEQVAATETGSEPAPVGRLVDRARAGDRSAFDTLVRRFSPMVHGILIGSAPRPEVEDLMQDVFLSAWTGLRGLRTAEHLGGWLATIARNRARRLHARRRTMDTLPDEVADATSGAGEDGAEVLELIRTLPNAYRETLCLRLVEGLTGPEIAELTGLTHGSVRVNLTRGMAKLRELLKQRGMQ